MDIQLNPKREMMSEETTTVEEVASEQTVEEVTTSEERPEWLPEKFNDPSELGKAYKELESKLGQKEEDIRAKLKEEFEQPKEGVPNSFGEYQMPSDIDFDEALGSDLLQDWAKHCHDNKYTHEEFQKGIEFYMAAQPEEIDIDAEAANLGDNAEARIDAASLFANQFFPEEVLPAIERMCETSDGIIALEYMMEQMKDPSVSDTTPAVGAISQAKLEEMMKDPRYHDRSQQDPHFIQMVNDGFQKLYG